MMITNQRHVRSILTSRARIVIVARINFYCYYICSIVVSFAKHITELSSFSDKTISSHFRMLNYYEAEHKQK